MDFAICASLWGGRLDPILEYFSPSSLINMASVNQAGLAVIQSYFSRWGKYVSVADILTCKGGKWHLYKDAIQHCLLLIVTKEDCQYFLPINAYRCGDTYKIYGWVVWDTNNTYITHGRWPNWIRLRDYDPHNVKKCIVWREKTEYAADNETH